MVLIPVNIFWILHIISPLLLNITWSVLWEIEVTYHELSKSSTLLSKTQSIPRQAKFAEYDHMVTELSPRLWQENQGQPQQQAGCRSGETTAEPLHSVGHMLGDAQIVRLSVLCRDILMSAEAGRILSILLSLSMNYWFSLLKYPLFIHLVL